MRNKNWQFVEKFLARFPDLSMPPQDQLSAIDFRLDNMQALVSALGSPQKDYPSLHIAGTNGKGSVSALCAAAFEAQGYKVGQYTSPHLAGLFAGIRVNGQSIRQEEAAGYLEHIRPTLDDLPGITSFEIVTALAFSHFSVSEVEVAVVETGLGGSLDATNVISPIVSVITPIDVEHQSILGENLSEISAHKAGIIKKNTPVVIAPQAEAARQVLFDKAQEMGANLIEVGRDFHFERRAFDFEKQSLSVWPASNPNKQVELEIRLHGRHQVENAATAFASLQAANERGLTIELRAIREGFADAHWPGRFEIVQGESLIVLDAAHTPAASRSLAETLEDYFPKKHVVALIGISGDKNLEALVAPIKNRLNQVVTTQSGHPRAKDARQLAAELQALGIGTVSIEDPAKALQKAKELIGEDSLLVVFGSVFLVERIRQLAQLKSESK